MGNKFRYAGEQYDSITGEYYLRARYYEPTIGRFMNEDTYKGQIENPQSMNLYAYCLNNPVIYIDPSEHNGANCNFDQGTGNGNVSNEQGDYNNNNGIPDQYEPKSNSTQGKGKNKSKGTVKNKSKGTGNLALTDDMKKAGITIKTIDGKQYYDYTDPVNKAFYNAGVESSKHKDDIYVSKTIWFISKVNHSAIWDIKRKTPWEKTIKAPYPGKYDTKIVAFGRLITPEELGNLMFGYTGTAAGFSEMDLIAGSEYAAGIYNIITDKDAAKNEANDHIFIREGIELYKSLDTTEYILHR